MNAISKVVAGLLIAASFAANAELGKEYDIRPDANVSNGPSAVDWQHKENAKLAEATKPEALAKFVKDAAAAEALLAQVKPAYATDAMVATQIAAITQLVMTPKCPKAPACRKVWTAALLKAAETSTEQYRTMFFLEQLRWCATKDQNDALAALGAKTQWKAVKDFIPMVVVK